MTEERTLPEGWQWIRFGDVVRQVKDRVDPESSDLSRYIAGEHMDSDDLTLRRWGEIGDGYLGPAFHRHFRPGQVLYGSRRTYLRKVAVADFEGVCANTTFVVEPSSDELLPDFLPLVMSAESFHEHSIQQSKGSVNPYINFKDLAWYEFALPPTHVQVAIAQSVATAWQACEAAAQVCSSTESLREAVIDEAIWDRSSGKWAVPLYRVGDVLSEKPRNGFSPTQDSSSEAVRSVTLSAIRDGKFIADDSTEKWCEWSDRADNFTVKVGDVFAVRGNGNRDLVGRVGLARTEPQPQCIYPDLLIRLRFDEAIIDPFLATAIWNYKRVHERLLSRAKSSNGIYKVNGKDISSHELPLPSMAERARLTELLESVEVLATASATQRREALSVYSSLRESLLRPGRNDHV